MTDAPSPAVLILNNGRSVSCVLSRHFGVMNGTRHESEYPPFGYRYPSTLASAMQLPSLWLRFIIMYCRRRFSACNYFGSGAVMG